APTGAGRGGGATWHPVLTVGQAVGPRLWAGDDHLSVLPSGDATCNGLQSKWLRTAINGNLGPDYLHLSIPSGQDYLQLRLLLSTRDCNQRPWDHITCDSPEPPSSACLYARGSTYLPWRCSCLVHL